MKNIRIAPIDNRGPNNVEAILRKRLERATYVRFASAFVTDKGLTSLLSALQRAAQKGPVEVLTGLYQSTTEPAALSALLGASNASKAFSARLSRETHFHQKLYVIESGNRTTVIVGSSNFTETGLRSHGEVSTLIEGPSRSPELRAFVLHFEREWRNAKGVTSPMIEAYAKQRKANPPATTKPVRLKAILKHSSHGSAPKTASRSPSLWRDWINGIVAAKTKDLVEAQTGWEKKGWSWHMADSRIVAGDQILVFDFEDQNIYEGLVTETTKMAIRTPDGVHVLAFKVSRRTPTRRMTKKRWKILKSVGLVSGRDDAQRVKKLKVGEWAKAIEALKRN